MRGDLGQPLGGWPEALQKKVLGDEQPITARPGSLIEAVDLEAARTKLSETLGHAASDQELASAQMYPKVFQDFAKRRDLYGPISILPTKVAFYGLEPGEEITVDLEQGKTMLIALATVGDPDEEGMVRVFFELNGQPRSVRVPDRKAGGGTKSKRKAEEGNPAHVAAPMPGRLASLAVEAGETVKQGQPLAVLEAMKMETTLAAARAGTIGEIVLNVGDLVDAKDLVMTIES